MARKILDREEEIDRAHVESLRERLKIAEEALVLYGWMPVKRDESEKDRLTFEAWMRWCRYVGTDRVGPKANPRIHEAALEVETQ